MSSDHSKRHRHGVVTRATALLLSWLVPAQSLMAIGPPPARPAAASSGPSVSLDLLGRGLPVRAAAAPAPLSPAFLAAAATPVAVATAVGPEVEAAVLDNPPGGGQGSGPQCGADEVNFFPCRKYVRTCGASTVFVVEGTVPAWAASPFRMHVQNGELNGTHRVSSATIQVNGVEVVRQNDLNQNVAGLDRSVNLTPQTTVKI